jgi:hypothetical protein
MKGKKTVSKRLAKLPRPTDTELAILEILKDLKTRQRCGRFLGS